jgi:hypothetical protein
VAFFKQDQWFKDWGSGALHDRLSADLSCICADGRTWSQAELVALLKSGADHWNEWHDSLERIRWYRKRGGIRHTQGFLCSIVRADFRRDNLDGFDLTGIEFTSCDFSRASFRGAHIGHPKGAVHLGSAQFRKCRFVGVDFESVGFGSAIFERCNFERALLNGFSSHGADFSYSRFARAMIHGDFEDAILVGTDFAYSHWSSVSFIDVDLSKAEGLLDVVVYAPVVLDHRTLWRSGPLSSHFYRMCGFPETFVDYMPSMVQRAINLKSCFISYSAHDDAFVGARIREELETAIHTQDKLLLVLSQNSIASQWVEYEVEAAIARENREKRDILFPITIDDEVFTTKKAWAATLRRQRHIGDFRNSRTTESYVTGLRRLLSDLAVDIE